MNRLKTVKGVSVALVASMMVSSLPANAQQSEMAALRQQIADMSERLNKMEADAKKTSEAAAKAGTPATSKFPVTVSGLLQVRGDTYFSEDILPGPPATAKQVDSFRLRRAEIRLTGRITPRLTGTVMIDPAKNPGRITTAAGGGNVDLPANGTVLQELALSYMLKQKPTGSLFIDAGQFKIPIGYEGDLVSSSAIQTIERALMFSQRDVSGGGYGDIRETGIRLRGTANEFGYELGIFNGLGERQNRTAAVDDKAFVGRLMYRPKNMGDTVIGISGGTGDVGPGVDRSVMNAFAAYKRDKLTLQAEYLKGDSVIVGLAPAPNVTRDVRGYYAHAGYLFTPKVEGVLRYDTFQLRRGAAAPATSGEIKQITAGVNYYIKGNNAKIQANIVHQNGTGVAGDGGGVGNDRTELRVQGQVAF